MTVQRLRESISAALTLFYPEIPVYVEGEKPTSAYFRPALISATYDRQREGRYMAVYRFGISYEQGTVLEAEALADGLCEALSVRESGGSAYRVVRQSWEAGTEERGPLFMVDYMLYLQKQPPDEAQPMIHLREGLELK